MIARRVLLVLCASSLLIACGPADGQMVLYVDTDAPVPAAPGSADDPTRTPWLFDRLRVEVLRAGTSQTLKDFAVNNMMFSQHRVSVGIVPPYGASDLVARVQLFRGDRLRNDGPPLQSTITKMLQLPKIDEDEHVDLMTTLMVTDVGASDDPEAATPATIGQPSLVGGWSQATPVACGGTPRADEVCVPGGAFWFGDPAIHVGDSNSIENVDEHLVVVAPFFIQKREVTVADFRVFYPNLPSALRPNVRNAAQDPSVLGTWCVWTDTPSDFEDDPMNCVDQAAAQAYCKSISADLPTEAQLEFVSSGRGREFAYPWGNDDPSCEDAVWGLAGGGGDNSQALGTPDCRGSVDLGGEKKSGFGARDRIALDGGELLDLAGNLAEWARDHYVTLDQPPWKGSGVLTDPLVTPPSGGKLMALSRGGSWLNAPFQLRAGYREGYTLDGANAPNIGFRCARSASP